jgi:hypothetical protein
MQVTQYILDLQVVRGIVPQAMALIDWMLSERSKHSKVIVPQDYDPIRNSVKSSNGFSTFQRD